MRTLKSIVVILTALSILAAGVILPDLLISRKLEGQIKAKNYIESEDMHRYGEEFFESKEHLNKVLLHAGEVRASTDFSYNENDEGGIAMEPVTEAPVTDVTDDRFESGYYRLLDFLAGWNQAVYTAFSRENVYETNEVSFEDGTVLGIVQCADISGLNGGMIIFDTETGIPLDAELYVYNSGSIGIEELWHGLASCYSGKTNMDFDPGERIYGATEPGIVNIRYAGNDDGSIKVTWEGVSNNELYFIHFYLE